MSPFSLEDPRLKRTACSLPVALFTLAALAAEALAGEAAAPWDPFPAEFPFYTACVSAPFPAKNTTNKSLTIHLGPAAAMSFDTDLLRMSAAWTGAFLTTKGVAFDTSHGGHPGVAGTVQAGTRASPGWADARGRFADPRPTPYGPLPERWGRWDGVYTVGDSVVLAYTVLGTKVHEQPSAIAQGGLVGFVRTFKLGRAPGPLGLLVADLEGAKAAETAAEKATPDGLALEDRGQLTRIAVRGAPKGARLALEGQRVILHLPAGAYEAPFKVVLARGGHDAGAAFAAMIESPPTMVDFAHGGPRHFPKGIVTRGELGRGPGPYVVDRLTTPFPGRYVREPVTDWKDNVYKRRIMIAGLDLFADGKRAAVSTWEGDVWIVEGIDDKLERLTWRRFASGGYEPLGLKIVDDVIYTAGRDQITRYHDLNGDGEADYYENFNNQVTSSEGFHEFQFDLQTDRAGNFYTAKASPVRAGGEGFGGGGGNGEMTAFAGTIQRISKDGRRR
jgi:hypothetical protein